MKKKILLLLLLSLLLLLLLSLLLLLHNIYKALFQNDHSAVQYKKKHQKDTVKFKNRQNRQMCKT